MRIFTLLCILMSVIMVGGVAFSEEKKGVSNVIHSTRSPCSLNTRPERILSRPPEQSPSPLIFF